MSGAGNRRGEPVDLDSILSDRLTQGRLALKLLSGGDKPFSREMLDGFVDSFLDGPSVAQERMKIEDAVQFGDFYFRPSLASPDKQLLHAAYLLYLMKNPQALRDPWGRKDIPLQQSRYWQDLTSCPDATAALGGFASAIDQNTTISFGAPGSWFYFDRDHDHVNIDFYYGLMLGFRHSHAVFLHERGHAELTERWPPSLTNIIQKIKEFEKKTKAGEELTKEEYVEYALLDAEATLRHMIFNSGEDNCVNRYAANLTPRMNYDVGYSLNNANVILQGTGETVLDLIKMNERVDGQQDPEQKKAWERFQNLQRTVMQAFYSTNRLFEPTPESWARLEVRPEWINETDWPEQRQQQHGPEPFGALMDMCIGKNGLANTQPRYSDRFFPGHSLKVSAASQRRNEILEQIWDIYAQPFLPPLLKLAEQQAQKNLQQAEANANKPPEDRGQQQPSGGGGSGMPGEKKNKVKVKGIGEAEGFKERGEKPGSGHPKPDKARSRTAGDVLKQVEDHKANEEARKKAKELADKPGGSGDEGGPGGQVKLEDLARKDWRDYSERKAELRPQIRRAAAEIIRIIRKQTEAFNRMSRQRDILPDRFEQAHYDLAARLNREQKENQGERLRREDMADWRQEAPDQKPAQIEFFFLIDGSASMKQGGKHDQIHGITRMEVALQLGIILYEGCKLANEILRGQAHIKTWVGIWGPEQIQLIAKPDGDPRVIGSNLETVRGTIDSGTDLTPALIQTCELLANQKMPEGAVSGSSHWIFASDGELYGKDIEHSRQCLLELMRSQTRSSVDVVLVNAGNTAMATMIEECKDSAGKRVPVDKQEIPDPEAAAQEVLRTILRRLGEGGISAAPDAGKRQAFRRLAAKMRELTGSKVPYGPYDGVKKMSNNMSSSIGLPILQPAASRPHSFT
jgi:hypothetical protein